MYFQSKIFQITFFATLLFTGLSLSVNGQGSREQLEKEKQANQEKINQIQGVLKKTSSQKSVNLKQLQVINSQIRAQKKQIDLINDDLKLLDRELNTLAAERRKLDQKMEQLKKEYAKMIYEAAKRTTTLNNLIFLFSAKTFNQFVLRYKYLKQYTDERQAQAKEMEGLRVQIAAQQERITAKKEEQKKTLENRLAEAKKLSSMQSQKNQVVAELSKQESELRAELAKSRQQAAMLEKSLRELIERERRERLAREKAARERAERERAEREARGEAPLAEAEKLDLSGMTDEEVKLASSFQASKTRLPWPVRGFVTEQFGRHAHPVLKGIIVDNLGIDIQTNSGEPVRAVYDGLVLDVNSMPGFNYVVAIQHGDYMTVYAKMKSVNVRPGQRVKARDPIGVVATNGEGTSELQFQVWRNTTKLNPEAWLMKR